MAEGTNLHPRCGALTKSGSPCRARALPDGRGFCFAHAPGSDQARAEGGRARSTARRGLKKLPPDLRAVADMLAEGIELTRDNKMKPPVLTAMAAGTTALLKVVELAVLAQQVDALRDQVAQLVAQRTIEGGSRL